MEDFICGTTKILQTAEGFGLRAWIVPIGILVFTYLFATGPIHAHNPTPKFGPAKEKPNLKQSWRPIILAVLLSMGFGYLNFQDHSAKMHTLKSGNYMIYEGEITKINALSRKGFTDRISFGFQGHVTKANKRSTKIVKSVYTNNIETRNGIMGVAGKGCFGRTCGLKVGDKVRILSKDQSIGGHVTHDTLRIEKCTG